MKLQPFKVDCKHVKIPFRAIVICPGCGADMLFDGTVDFPWFGKSTQLSDECECGTEVITTVMLEATVEIGDVTQRRVRGHNSYEVPISHIEST